VAYRAGFFGDSKPRPMGVGRDLAGCRADGSEFPVEIGLNPIDTEAGVMVLASIIDITERQRTQQRLEDALLEKTVLLNEVHHRVKNNLQVITSLLNLQADHAADPRLRAMLAESCGRVKAMALTHQLLYERKDFSRLDLGDYLERLMHSIRATYRGTGDRIMLRLVPPQESVHSIWNGQFPAACCSMNWSPIPSSTPSPGNVAVEILIELNKDSAGLIRFSVADDGIGLPRRSVLASRVSLGLQLVPLLVEQLHGTLGNQSGNAGHGSASVSKHLVERKHHEREIADQSDAGRRRTHRRFRPQKTIAGLWLPRQFGRRQRRAGSHQYRHRKTRSGTDGHPPGRTHGRH
jgi:two-component sensor histidine kinase